MGIPVKCPHGHTFKVKDKYAGKRGLCPHCPSQVVVQVPALETSSSAEEAYRNALLQEHRAKNPAPPPPSGVGNSVFDDHATSSSNSGTSGSLLGSSVIRHNNLKCGCGASVPMWYAKCPNCGEFMQTR